MIPGWPYSVIAAVEPGRTSWTLPLDAVRPGPADDATEVTAAQVREVVTRIIDAAHWREGDPGIVVVFDSVYDLTPLAGANGRPSRHGAAFRLADEKSWPAPAVTADAETTRYGTARATAWSRCTSGWPAAPAGNTTTRNCRSSTAPSSGCR